MTYVMGKRDIAIVIGAMGLLYAVMYFSLRHTF